MAEKTVDLALPAPEVLAQEIFDQALELTARLEKLFEEQGEIPKSAILQEALIHLGQSLLLGLTETLSRTLSPEEIEDFANQVFLKLGRLILVEFIQREPSSEEWEYFLTYFRSHFELLRRELQGLEEEFQGEEIPLDQKAEELLTEARKRIEALLGHFFS